MPNIYVFLYFPSLMIHFFELQMEMRTRKYLFFGYYDNGTSFLTFGLKVRGGGGLFINVFML